MTTDKASANVSIGTIALSAVSHKLFQFFMPSVSIGAELPCTSICLTAYIFITFFFQILPSPCGVKIATFSAKVGDDLPELAHTAKYYSKQGKRSLRRAQADEA